MNNNILISDSHAVFGENELVYQCVLDDFKNAKFIGIMTFNISPKTDSFLLKALKSACAKGTNAVVITNIPKRFSFYYKTQYAVAAKDMIDLYKQQLDPRDYGMRLNPYFSFNNHAKIVMTDNIVYWGSNNFSDESCRNIECGTISTDKALIEYLKDNLFPNVQNKSVPYYKHNFAVAIANLESLIPVCKMARQSLFDASYEPWADYDTNFEEKWIYRTTDNGLTSTFLRNFISFFSRFDNALNVIDDIVDEYCELDELPDQVAVLKDLLEEYKREYDAFFDAISLMFEDLKEMAQYDLSDEACRKIAEDYGMEAYDEKLDYYVEIAMNEATEEYEELIKGSEQTIHNALNSLDSIILYIEQLKENLYQALEINANIDNTGVT